MKELHLRRVSVLSSKYIFCSRRFAFLFEHSMLLCKTRGDMYDVKEIFDLQKFIIGDVPPIGKGKVSKDTSVLCTRIRYPIMLPKLSCTCFLFIFMYMWLTI